MNMSDKLFLSIITINFNNSSGLKKTLESVKNQTSKNYEHIIIDGASTDGSVDLIKEFLMDSEYAKQVSFWCSEKDKGIYDALNKGISHANGRYCLFLNAGDYFADENVVKRFDDYNLTEDIVYTNALIFTRTSERKSVYPERLSALYFYTKMINHQNTFIKTECQKKHLYSLNFKILSDREFFLYSFLQEGTTQRYINDVIAKYEAETGISSINKELAEKEMQEIKKMYFTKPMIESLNYFFEEEKALKLELDDYRNGYKGILRKLRVILMFIANHTVRKNKDK